MAHSRRRLSQLLSIAVLAASLGSWSLPLRASPAIGSDAFIDAFGERAVEALDSTRDTPRPGAPASPN